MNWYGFKNAFKAKKNKIFAVLFSFLGLAFLLTCYSTQIARYGFGYFTSNWNTLLSFILYLLVYSLIFVCNIRNDNFAYQGILMFVFYMTFDAFWLLMQNTGLFQQLFNARPTWETLPYLFYAINIPGTLTMGILLYIFSLKYMRGGNIEFGRVRLFAILFAAAVAINAGLTIWINWYIQAVTIQSLLPYIFMSASSLCIAISVIFTMERLRRI